MTEIIDESVSVDLVSNAKKRCSFPWMFLWRGSHYRVRKVGFHHTVKEGRTLYHIFSVTDGNTCFKLKFDTETLFWKLLEVDSS